MTNETRNKIIHSILFNICWAGIIYIQTSNLMHKPVLLTVAALLFVGTHFVFFSTDFLKELIFLISGFCLGLSIETLLSNSGVYHYGLVDVAGLSWPKKNRPYFFQHTTLIWLCCFHSILVCSFKVFNSPQSETQNLIASHHHRFKCTRVLNPKVTHIRAACTSVLSTTVARNLAINSIKVSLCHCVFWVDVNSTTRRVEYTTASVNTSFTI